MLTGPAPEHEYGYEDGGEATDDPNGHEPDENVDPDRADEDGSD